MYNVQNTSATGLFNQLICNLSRIEVGDASQCSVSFWRYATDDSWSETDDASRSVPRNLLDFGKVKRTATARARFKWDWIISNPKHFLLILNVVTKMNRFYAICFLQELLLEDYWSAVKHKNWKISRSRACQWMFIKTVQLHCKKLKLKS